MKRQPTARKIDQQSPGRWTYDGVPAVRELLDHIARELAEEYVRLVKEAAAGSSSGMPPKREETE